MRRKYHRRARWSEVYDHELHDYIHAMVAKRIGMALACCHSLIILCYVAPEQLVPDRLRFWSQAYARPLFHQQWELFAPEPPRCWNTILTENAPSLHLVGERAVWALSQYAACPEADQGRLPPCHIDPLVQRA
ncbi:MAG: hypothetical protein KDB88_00865, partial [Flavobacteriales bacterium]|nr:hypothetical protein [Flavobacteriales bacterium]